MSMKLELKSEYIELVKLLKLAGFAESGGQAKIMVEEGDVLVDGQVELRKRFKVRPGQTVVVGEQSVEVA
ncbi:MAG: RNA-binding S4 domain-containing protein [Victivallales bacterium]|nr:RNA-binding S4 domain-containing protein [Victivallales bacterium]